MSRDAFEIVPPEIIVKIFMNLPLEELKIGRLTCKRWSAIIESHLTIFRSELNNDSVGALIPLLAKTRLDMLRVANFDSKFATFPAGTTSRSVFANATSGIEFIVNSPEISHESVYANIVWLLRLNPALQNLEFGAGVLRRCKMRININLFCLCKLSICIENPGASWSLGAFKGLRCPNLQEICIMESRQCRFLIQNYCAIYSFICKFKLSLRRLPVCHSPGYMRMIRPWAEAHPVMHATNQKLLGLANLNRISMICHELEGPLYNLGGTLLMHQRSLKSLHIKAGQLLRVLPSITQLITNCANLLEDITVESVTQETLGPDFRQRMERCQLLKRISLRGIRISSFFNVPQAVTHLELIGFFGEFLCNIIAVENLKNCSVLMYANLSTIDFTHDDSMLRSCCSVQTLKQLRLHEDCLSPQIFHFLYDKNLEFQREKTDRGYFYNIKLKNGRNLA